MHAGEREIFLPSYRGKMKIAIDGPAGSGKSTVAKRLSQELGYEYLDTGALYRGAAWLLHEKQIPLDREDLVKKSLEEAVFSFSGNRLYLNDQCIEEEIRSNAVSKIVSLAASRSYVREILTRSMKEIARTTPDIILDGRDIGTVVLPEAEVKIYLDAGVGIRAKRRHLELIAKGEKVDLSVLEEEIRHRDHLDRTRKDGPLAVAPDAVIIHTDEMTIEEVVSRMVEIRNNALLKQ